MNQIICEHCNEPVGGKAYRVISQEDDVVLLDMVVCADCAMQAKALRLETHPLAFPIQRQQHG